MNPFDSDTETERTEPARPSISREVDFGPKVLVVAIAIFVLLVAAILRWTAAGATGWQVVSGDPGVTALPRLFSVLALVFGVGLSVASVMTRRWVLVFVTAAGCAVTSVTGVWAVWSQNTVPGGGPGFGLVLALLAMVVLTGRWAGWAFSRT
ncbi:Rv2732c family membrane protein [Actinomycetospora sp. CA-084318]|uniref:Rv2732c family membrane protein n=1 Tax=Actinomycetospora sp. CA-084318 TaxID=3239892 RepID=UPI003D96D72F